MSLALHGGNQNFPQSLFCSQQHLYLNWACLQLGSQLSLEDLMPLCSQTELPTKQVFSKEETGQFIETTMANQGLDEP